MGELIQQFLTNEVVPLQQYIGEAEIIPDGPFVQNFQRYINEDSRLNPATNPSFFMYMFLGSFLTLPHSGLMESIGTEKMLIWKQGQAIHVCFYQIFNQNKKFVFRTIDFRKNAVEPSFNDDILRDIVNQLDLNFNQLFNCPIDWQMLSVTETFSKPFYKLNLQPIDVPFDMYEKIVKITNVNFQHEFVLFQPKPQVPQVFSLINENFAAYQHFSTIFEHYVGNRYDNLMYLMSDLFVVFNDQYCSGIVDLPADSHIDYNAFIAGSIVMNMKARYDLHCVIEHFNGETMFKFAPKPNYNNELNINVPIFIEESKNRPPQKSDRIFKNVFEIAEYSNFLTDAKTGLKTIPVYGPLEYSLTSSRNELISVNQGFMHKFCKHYDYFLFEMPENDIKSVASEEVKYIFEMIGTSEKQFLSHFIFGQLLSLQPPEYSGHVKTLEKYMYIYDITMNKKVTTFIASNDDQLWLMVHVYSQEYERADVKITSKQLSISGAPQDALFLHIDIYIKQFGFDVDVRKERYDNPKKLTRKTLEPINTINPDKVVNFDNDQELTSLLPNELSMHENFIGGTFEMKSMMRGLLSKFSVLNTKLKPFESVFSVYQIANKPDSFAHFLQGQFPNYNEILRNAKVTLIKCKRAAVLFDIESKIQSTSKELLYEYIIAGDYIDGGTPSLVSLLLHKDLANKRLQLNFKKEENVDISSLVVEQSNLFDMCLNTEVRKKRGAKTKCLITWKDIDEIGGTARSKKELALMKINGTKFMKYITEKSENSLGKVKQIKELLSYLNLKKNQIIGTNQYKAFEVIRNYKYINSLNSLSNTANMFTHGLIFSHIFSDVAHGNYKSAEVYSLLLFGSIVSIKSATLLEQADVKLKFTNNLLSSVLFTSSPFVRRFTAGYNVYDLVQNIKQMKVAKTDATVGIINDATFLTVDTTEIGLIFSETAGLVEGAAISFTLVGSILAAAVFIGSDIYTTQEQVQNLNHFMHLSVAEQFYQGLRIFFGLGMSSDIEKLVKEKEYNNQMVISGVNYLKNLTSIQAYIYSMYDNNLKCDENFYKSDDNILLVKLQKNDWGSTMPDISNGYKLICFPNSDGENIIINDILPYKYYMQIVFGKKLPKNLSKQDSPFLEDNSNGYFCNNAIGVSKAESRNNSVYLIDLKDGDDFAIGVQNHANVFLIGNGYKNISGGTENDNFILYGNETKGIINGGDGINIIDLTNFGSSLQIITVTFKLGNSTVSYNNKQILLTNIQAVLGRVNRSDVIECSCETMYVNGQNHNDYAIDIIFVPLEHCNYKIQFKVSGCTKIINNAKHGEFAYLINERNVNSTIYFNPKATRANVRHEFAFNYPFVELEMIEMKNQVKNGSKFLIFTNIDKNNILTIENFQSNNTFHFSDNTILKVDNRFHAFVFTNESVHNVVKMYPPIANRLHTFIIAWSGKDNATILIGHQNSHLIGGNSTTDLFSANIMHNDPYHETHFVNGLSENVYIITCGKEKPNTAKDCQFQDVVLHGFPHKENEKSFINTLHLGEISKSIEKHLNGSLGIKIASQLTNGDLIIHLAVSQVMEYNIARKFDLGKIILRHTLFTESYKKLLIVNKGPFQVDYDSIRDRVKLMPVPLKFGNDTSEILITIDDIEQDMEIVVPKVLGDFEFLKQNQSIILTNMLKAQQEEKEQHLQSPTSIIFKDYFMNQYVMNSLKLKFEDKTIHLSEYRNEIGEADSIKDRLEEFA